MSERQIAPRELNVLVDDPEPDRARRAMQAELKMGKISVDEIEAPPIPSA